MVGEKTTRELIYETNRDVKWICDALQRMEARDGFESRPPGRWKDGGLMRPGRSGGDQRSAPGPAGWWRCW